MNICLIICYLLLIETVWGEITCRSSHWPLTQGTCALTAHSAKSIAASETGLCYRDLTPSNQKLSREIMDIWDLKECISTSCTSISGCIVTALFPHDPLRYGISGSNYYVFHVDIILPLWNYINFKLKCPSGIVRILMFHLGGDGRVVHSTDIYEDLTSFWMQSFRLVFGNQLIPVHNKSTTFQWMSKDQLLIPSIPADKQPLSQYCFEQISFGIPEYSFPSRKSISTLSAKMRHVSDMRNVKIWWFILIYMYMIYFV